MSWLTRLFGVKEELDPNYSRLKYRVKHDGDGNYYAQVETASDGWQNLVVDSLSSGYGCRHVDSSRIYGVVLTSDRAAERRCRKAAAWHYKQWKKDQSPKSVITYRELGKLP